jgi:hypothetical protein
MPACIDVLGHDEATPTSKITANVVVIRNCILLFQSAKNIELKSHR